MRKLLSLIAFTIAFAPASALALNQASNFDFSSPATYWTSFNTGIYNTCAALSTTTTTAWPTFQRNSTAVTSWTGQLATVGTEVSGYIWQKFTVPGSGAQNVRGILTYSANINGGNASTYVRLDAKNITDSLFDCENFSTSVATTTTKAATVSLTGGTSYMLIVTELGRTTAGGAGKFTNLFATNVIVSTPPVNPAATAPGGTTNVGLTWDASTATTTANGLAAANGYGIYRGTASFAETAYASSTSNSYTDSGATGNTTYFYWLTNTDTALFESASSTEVSQLTRPGAPTMAAATNIGFTTMTVNWNAPTGGATTYKLEQCTHGTNTCSLTTAISGTTQAISSLKANTVYDFATLGTNATGDGAWSATTTQSTTIPTTQLILRSGSISFRSGKIIFK